MSRLLRFLRIKKSGVNDLPSQVRFRKHIKPSLPPMINIDPSQDNNEKDQQEKSSSGKRYMYSSLLASPFFYYYGFAHNDDQGQVGEGTASSVKEWPVFRRDEIAKHSTKEDIWVTYQGNVYDITKFLPNHPGGYDKLLLAGGKDIESFWNLYRQHYNSATPLNLLSTMQIGILHPEDVSIEEAADSALEESMQAVADPYANEPEVDGRLEVICAQPINAQPKPTDLATAGYFTPNELFFVRNHHPVPIVTNLENYQVYFLIEDAETLLASQQAVNQADKTSTDATIHSHQSKNTSIKLAKAPADINPALPFLCQPTSEAPVYQPVSQLNLQSLLTRYPKTEVTTSIQCGGNRRGSMTAIQPTNGANWDVTAIGTARWQGVLLRDLLADLYPGLTEQAVNAAGVNYPYQHVHFVGLDGMEASIPLWKAMSSRIPVLLANSMNDQPIPANHGYPLRVIVPGHVGVRNVKWLVGIRLAKEEAYGTWQRGMAYKGFGPSVKNLTGIDLSTVPTTQEQPVTSAITRIQTAKEGGNGNKLTIEGYAYSGGGRGIIRVDLSLDNGLTWQNADLLPSGQTLDQAWAWTLWKKEIDLSQLQPELAGSKQGGQQPSSSLQVICKAVDASYNSQPDSMQGIWNLRGINNNAWHRVTVTVPPSPEVAAVEGKA